MARRAKRNYIKGVYQLLYKENNIWDLVYTTSLDKNINGTGLNADLVLAKNITWSDLKTEIKKNKITRAIWYGRNDYSYVMPKDVLSGKCGEIIVCNNKIW